MQTRWPGWAVWTIRCAGDCMNTSVIDDQPAGRDQAAAATGISRTLAAYHLDKLVKAGLLSAVTPARPDAADPELDARPRFTVVPSENWP